MTYRLKPGGPAIDVVDGPLAGRKFEHGTVYAEIPPGLESRFEAVPTVQDGDPAPAAKGRKAKTEEVAS